MSRMPTAELIGMETAPGLTELMKRVNCVLHPDEFIETVSCAFQDVQGGGAPDEIKKIFLTEPSYQLFRKALALASQRNGAGRSILVVGCGRGFAGEDAEFAADAVREIFRAQRPAITTFNLTPAALRDAAQGLRASQLVGATGTGYHLVVTHSMFHYIPDIASAFALIRELIHPSGGLVVGHEPNANFWNNAECQATIAKLQRGRRVRRWLRYVNPRRYLGRSRAPQVPQDGVITRVNRRLQEHYGLGGPLSADEIQRLVDIHRPSAVRGTFRVGSDGFDFHEWTQTFLPGFRLEWAGSTGQLGYISSSSLSERWRRKEIDLAARHPLAGSVFSAFWSRNVLR